MDLVKQQHRQEVILNTGIWLVVLVFLALAALQVNNLSSGCTFPDLPYEYIWNAWSAMVPNTCAGPRFASLTSDGKLRVSCRANASISLALYPPKEIFYDHPLPVSGEFTVANCQFDASRETNVVVHLNKSAASIARASALLSSLPPSASVSAPSPSSVLVILLSSLSDAHFERTLSATYSLLRDKELLGSKDLEAFHFERYNAISSSPLTNTLSIFHGAPSASSSDSQWLWAHYRSSAYVTLYAEEDCRYMQSVRKHFSNADMLDHRFTELFCQLEMRRRVGSPVEDTSAGPMCLGSSYQHEILFDYLRQFTSAYSVPRFGVVLFNEASENSMVRIKSIDQDLRSFLLGIPNNTFVFLLSEMGAHETSYALRSRAGKLEKARPFLYILSPRKGLAAHSGVREALRANERRLISGLDIYATLQQIPILGRKGSAPAAGQSLFTQLSDTRSCSAASIERPMCACENRLALYLMLLLLPFSIIFWWLWTWTCRNRERRAQQSRNLLV